jgi:hypothetical protein
MTITRAPAAFIAGLLFACFTLPARAEMGPCKPLEPREVLICGSGKGAAIVIPDTPSPSGRLALAWRTPDAPPTEPPKTDNIELLVLRLADGAILARGKTEFWDTGAYRANRLEEKADWSPNSRLMVRTFHSRFSTDHVDIYAFDADDKAAGPLDLLKILDPAARARLRARVPHSEDYSFYLSHIKDGETPVAIDDRGHIRAEVMFWVPKKGPYYYYTVMARVTRAKGSLQARIVSIAYVGKLEE